MEDAEIKAHCRSIVEEQLSSLKREYGIWLNGLKYGVIAIGALVLGVFGFATWNDAIFANLRNRILTEAYVKEIKDQVRPKLTPDIVFVTGYSKEFTLDKDHTHSSLAFIADKHDKIVFALDFSRIPEYCEGINCGNRNKIKLYLDQRPVSNFTFTEPKQLDTISIERLQGAVSTDPGQEISNLHIVSISLDQSVPKRFKSEILTGNIIVSVYGKQYTIQK